LLGLTFLGIGRGGTRTLWVILRIDQYRVDEEYIANKGLEVIGL